MDNDDTSPEHDDEMDPTTALITTYNELNSPTIDTLTEPPSALEFMRFVAKNRPFVVRGGAADWEAVKTWNVEVLRELLEGESVNVAVTPMGYIYIFFSSLLDVTLDSFLEIEEGFGDLKSRW